MPAAACPGSMLRSPAVSHAPIVMFSETQVGQTRLQNSLVKSIYAHQQRSRARHAPGLKKGVTAAPFQPSQHQGTQHAHPAATNIVIAHIFAAATGQELRRLLNWPHSILFLFLVVPQVLGVLSIVSGSQLYEKLGTGPRGTAMEGGAGGPHAGIQLLRLVLRASQAGSLSLWQQPWALMVSPGQGVAGRRGPAC